MLYILRFTWVLHVNRNDIIQNVTLVYPHTTTNYYHIIVQITCLKTWSVVWQLKKTLWGRNVLLPKQRTLYHVDYAKNSLLVPRLKTLVLLHIHRLYSKKTDKIGLMLVAPRGTQSPLKSFMWCDTHDSKLTCSRAPQMSSSLYSPNGSRLYLTLPLNITGSCMHNNEIYSQLNSNLFNFQH